MAHGYSNNEITKLTGFTVEEILRVPELKELWIEELEND